MTFLRLDSQNLKYISWVEYYKTTQYRNINNLTFLPTFNFIYQIITSGFFLSPTLICSSTEFPKAVWFPPGTDDTGVLVSTLSTLTTTNEVSSTCIVCKGPPLFSFSYKKRPCVLRVPRFKRAQRESKIVQTHITVVSIIIIIIVIIIIITNLYIGLIAPVTLCGFHEVTHYQP